MIRTQIGQVAENSLIKFLGEVEIFYVIDSSILSPVVLVQSTFGETRTVDRNTNVELVAPINRGFTFVSEESIGKLMDSEKYAQCLVTTESGILPKRATKNSAGYDIITPREFKISPNGKIVVFTNIKAYMQDNEVLIANVRSSMGIKLDLMLSNTQGWIDSDYYDNEDNEGNIAVALRNIGDTEVSFKRGDAIGQLAFFNFLVSDNCNTEEVRIGGLGSTTVEG